MSLEISDGREGGTVTLGVKTQQHFTERDISQSATTFHKAQQQVTEKVGQHFLIVIGHKPKSLHYLTSRHPVWHRQIKLSRELSFYPFLSRIFMFNISDLVVFFNHIF